MSAEREDVADWTTNQWRDLWEEEGGDGRSLRIFDDAEIGYSAENELLDGARRKLEMYENAVTEFLRRHPSGNFLLVDPLQKTLDKFREDGVFAEGEYPECVPPLIGLYPAWPTRAPFKKPKRKPEKRSFPAPVTTSVPMTPDEFAMENKSFREDRDDYLKRKRLWEEEQREWEAISKYEPQRERPKPFRGSMPTPKMYNGNAAPQKTLQWFENTTVEYRGKEAVWHPMQGKWLFALKKTRVADAAVPTYRLSLVDKERLQSEDAYEGDLSDDESWETMPTVGDAPLRFEDYYEKEKKDWVRGLDSSTSEYRGRVFAAGPRGPVREASGRVEGN